MTQPKHGAETSSRLVDPGAAPAERRMRAQRCRRMSGGGASLQWPPSRSVIDSVRRDGARSRRRICASHGGRMPSPHGVQISPFGRPSASPRGAVRCLPRLVPFPRPSDRSGDRRGTPGAARPRAGREHTVHRDAAARWVREPFGHRRPARVRARIYATGGPLRAPAPTRRSQVARVARPFTARSHEERSHRNG